MVSYFYPFCSCLFLVVVVGILLQETGVPQVTFAMKCDVGDHEVFVI